VAGSGTAPSWSGRDGLIRAGRRQAGLSQRELAGRAGVSVGMVRDLEQGRTVRPHGPLVAQLAAVLRLAPVEALPAGGPHRPEAGLRLRVLGPLGAWRDGSALALGQPRGRAVLGLLALRANTSVHVADLVAGVWDGRPPAGAADQVRAHVGRLRGILDPGRASRDPAGLLVATGRGYRLQLDPGQLDWLRFRELTGWARASTDPMQRCSWYERALTLWPDGRALSDLDLPAVADAERVWESAVTSFTTAALDAGNTDRALPYLWTLAERDPVNERIHALLMRALAVNGHPAAALRVFADIRRRLDDDLGLEPGAELTETHRGLLSPEVSPPRQLPAGLPGFVGRGAELAALTDRLDRPGAAAVIAVEGAAGIGKTTLAVHWAHAVAARFPDGQLHLDLRGYDPVAPPLSIAEAIRALLDALLVPDDRMPDGLDAQAALYRRLLAGQRMLILLDNARDTDQLRPLLPDNPAGLVVVTSRRRLTGPLPAHTVHRITLGLLAPTDARALLAARLGADRAAAEEPAVDELVALCAGMPLALSVAAARCAARPDFPVATLVEWLRDRRHQLDTLSGDAAATDLRSLFWASYQQLTPDAALLFRMLGAYPGLDVTVAVAAALAAVDRASADRVLAEVAGAHLIAERSPGRYVMHDLLRAYAGELGAERDGEAALDRVFHYFLLSLDRADRLRHPHSRPLWTPVPVPGVQPEAFSDSDAALNWCQGERASLAALIGRVAERGPAAYLATERWSLWLYFHLWSHRADLGEARRVVLVGIRPIDPVTAGPEPPPARARAEYRRLVERAQARGQRTVAAYCLFGLIQMLARRGRRAEALHFAESALAWFREIGDRAGIALAVDQIGRYHG
jgi:DNA-binding SARP family transcriptional activator/DNA-binding XRE family transcriptional regulator